MFWKQHQPTALAAAALICALGAAPALAGPGEATPIATEQLGGTILSVTPKISYERAVLRVSGPDDYALSKHYPPGTPITADLLTEAVPMEVEDRGMRPQGPGGSLPEGKYRYEVVLRTAEGVERRHTGLFFVRNGSPVSRRSVRGDLDAARSDLAREATASAGGPGGEGYISSDWIYVADASDDGLTYLLLDSDNSGGSTHERWALANREGTLQIEECEGTNPHSGCERYVMSFPDDSNGRVGIGTTVPLSELHIDSSDGADILLTGSGAEWTVGILASSNQFILRDATNNASIVRLDQGAPASSLVISTDGRIGLGTASPAADLDVRGHVRGTTFASASSRELKAGFEAVDAGEILARVGELPVTTWRYRDDDEENTHIGPVAEDFQRLFGLGDGETISNVDVDGVTLAAIQALQQELGEKERLIADLNARLAAVERRLPVEAAVGASDPTVEQCDGARE